MRTKHGDADMVNAKAGEEFVRLGLIRMGAAAKRLHLAGADIHKFRRAGQLKVTAVPWKGGVTLYGFPADDLRALHDRMWPRCPWAEKGLCLLAAEEEKGRKIR